VPAADLSDAQIEAKHSLGVRAIRLNLVNPQFVGLAEVVALCARVAGRGWHLQVQIRWNDAAQDVLADVAARVTLPLVGALVAANPEQLLWASDWPHTERFTPTPHDADLVDLLPDWLGSDDLRRRVCVANPARLYGY
jgi:predicted TIM-barrel fold metal-dependent hydrolase